MFGRRTSTNSQTETETELDPTSQDETPAGKGRATPKRKDAEAARKKRMSPPKNRKEANALHKERVREQRAKQREALAGGGDDRYLPARDRGPVKKLIRDYVDSRHTIGEFLIPAFILLFLLSVVLTPLTQYIGTASWLIVLALLAADSVRVIRGLRKKVTERFGPEEARGNTMYALMRSWQMRRLRLPKPAVKPGDPI